MENIRQESHLLPWRPDSTNDETEEDCEDPDRLVLYEDISPALFRITKSKSCLKIVCLFLNFLGFNSPKIHKLLDQWQNSGSLQFGQYLLTNLWQSPYLLDFFLDLETDAKWKPTSSLLHFLKEILEQSERYFSGSNRTLFTLLRLDLEICKHSVLKVCELQLPNKKELKKFGKSLLRETQNRSNLVLWESYIRLLWASSDKISETVEMINVALGMFLGASSEPDTVEWLGLCNLCKTYSQILLNFEPLEHIKECSRRSAPTDHDKQQVMLCLCALLDNKKLNSVRGSDLSPALMLRIKKRFEKKVLDIIEQLTMESTFSNYDGLVAIVDCFALFEFCAIDSNAANKVYETTREKVRTVASQHKHIIKYLYHSQIAMLSNVLHITNTSRTQMKSLINSALSEFPDCPLLQASFISFESKSYIFGKLRKFYDKALKVSSCASTSLSAVGAELLRHDTVVKSAAHRNLNKPGKNKIHF